MRDSPPMVLVAGALLACPIAGGILLGIPLRRRAGHRVSGVASLHAMLALPTVAAMALTVAFPLVGLWDAATEGLLCGIGMLCSAHTVAAEPRNVRRTALSVLATGLLLESGARLVLGPPPAYPVGQGPSFLLATMLRTAGPDSYTFHVGGIPDRVARATMDAPPGGGRMEDRPPSQMVTREIVCTVAYGSAYTGSFQALDDHTQGLPENFARRPGAARTVLHVGDSMVFGTNVERNETFGAELERLEPDTQHVNAGLSGAAPDDYLIVLRGWVARHTVDLAVLYLFAGNDMNGLDAPHPCSNWESILVYERGRARLRFPGAPKFDRGIGVRWLLVNSPLPYLARVLIVWRSAAAAFLGNALDAAASRAARGSAPPSYEHLEAILATARDELASRRIPLVVVVLPQGRGIDVPGGPSDSLSRQVRRITERLAIPTLDARPTIRDALTRGANPIQPDGSHFNPEGHRLIAAWLHRELPATSHR